MLWTYNAHINWTNFDISVFSRKSCNCSLFSRKKLIQIYPKVSISNVCVRNWFFVEFKENSAKNLNSIEQKEQYSRNFLDQTPWSNSSSDFYRRLTQTWKKKHTNPETLYEKKRELITSEKKRELITSNYYHVIRTLSPLSSLVQLLL